jgi:hypothetical protein
MFQAQMQRHQLADVCFIFDDENMRMWLRRHHVP